MDIPTAHCDSIAADWSFIIDVLRLLQMSVLRMDVKIEKRDDLKVFATLDNASSLKKELEFKDPRFSSFSVFRSYSSFSRMFFLTQRCINLS